MSTILIAFGKPILNEIFTEKALIELQRLADMETSEIITSRQELDAALGRFKPEVLVTGWGSTLLDRELVEKNPQLKYVCHCGGSVQQIIPKELISNGLLVTNWGTFPSTMVAEAALAGMFACLRKTVEVSDIMHRQKGWMRLLESKTETLFSQRVGIAGFGASGQALARLLQPFQCDISAYSPYEKDDVFLSLNVRRVHSIRQLFQTNKIISVHLSLTPANYHLINDEILAELEDGGIIVNTARGKIIDENALIRELVSGRIYASLDVFENEPLPGDSKLRGLPNVHLTPHQGSPTADKRREIGNIALKNIKRYFSGQELLDLIDENIYDFIT